MNSILKFHLSFLIWISYLFLQSLPLTTARVTYTGYEAHRFVPITEEDLQILQDLEAKNPGVIFLKQPGNKGASVDMLFPAHLQTDLLTALSEKMPSSLISNDIESLMDHETHITALEEVDAGEFPFTMYWNLAKLFSFYKQLETLHPELVKTHQYGESFEKRPLTAVIVSSAKSASSTEKPVMLIDGGTHAREWITVMSCAYFLNEVVTNSQQYQHILDKFDFIFVCSINPDGFEYSWTMNRLWRKNRQTNGSPLAACSGTDPNRNYDIGHLKGGSSSDQCAETYAGKVPFSCPETKSFTDFAFTRNVISYISLHSYSQFILLSFGCREIRPERYPQFDTDLLIANNAITALHAIHGTEYQAGNSDEILYEACGTSADWFKGPYGSRFAYTYELRDTGTFGFILPADQVQPCAEETAAALRVMHESMMAQFLMEQKETE